MSVKLPENKVLGVLTLTPLIDVVFLLLIFFLVVTRFADEDRELDVNLPTASEAMPMTAKPKDIFVNINKKGEYFMGSHKVTLEEMEENIREAIIDNPRRRSVIIRADRDSTAQHFTNVVNICKKLETDHVLTIEGNKK